MTNFWAKIKNFKIWSKLLNLLKLKSMNQNWLSTFKNLKDLGRY